MIAVRGPIRVVAALVAGLLVALLAPATSADAAPPSVVEVQTYSYDDVAVPVLSDTRVAERGSPTASYDDTTYIAADRGSSGASLRSGDTTTPANHTYDDPARFVRGASGSRNIEGASSGAEASSFAFDCSRVAAKLAPRQIDASWGGLIKYKHGGPMTAIEHINYRHAYTSGFSNVSKYSKGTSVRNIQGYVDDALRHGSVSADGTMVRHNVGRVIGTDQLGNPVTGIQMYVRNGQIQTAFPVAWP